MEGSRLGMWLKISEVIIHPPKAIYGGRGGGGGGTC